MTKTVKLRQKFNGFNLVIGCYSNDVCKLRRAESDLVQFLRIWKLRELDRTVLKLMPLNVEPTLSKGLASADPTMFDVFHLRVI